MQCHYYFPENEQSKFNSTTGTTLCKIQLTKCINDPSKYSHSVDVFTGQGIGGITDEQTRFTNSSEKKQNIIFLQ